MPVDGFPGEVQMPIELSVELPTLEPVVPFTLCPLDEVVSEREPKHLAGCAVHGVVDAGNDAVYGDPRGLAHQLRPPDAFRTVDRSFPMLHQLGENMGDHE